MERPKVHFELFRLDSGARGSMSPSDFNGELQDISDIAYICPIYLLNSIGLARWCVGYEILWL